MSERDEVLKVCEALKRIAHGGLQEPNDAFTLGQAVGLLLKLSRPRDERGRFIANGELSVNQAVWKDHPLRDEMIMCNGNVHELPPDTDLKGWVRPPHPWPWPDEDALEADKRLSETLWPPKRKDRPLWQHALLMLGCLLLVIGLVAGGVAILQQWWSP